MSTGTCIFVSRPPECSVCLDCMKIMCLMNHRNHLVTEVGKAELRILLDEEMVFHTRTRIEPRKE
jgi:hypothetical protein